jgi:hypothetical protein
MFEKHAIEKSDILVYILGALLFGMGSILLNMPLEAKAGGRDDRPAPSQTSTSPKQPNEQLPTPSVLNWERWESPYWSNNNICRESKGNIICLSPEIARQVRWEIPSQEDSL